MQRPAGIPIRKRAFAAAFLRTTTTSLVFFFLLFLTVVTADSSHTSQVECSRTCAAENCDSIAIRYGKYCGVAWTGCPGEKPCDDIDACCKIHDECVTVDGMINVNFHEKFKKCIMEVKKSGKEGFSRECPYDQAVSTMAHAMDMGIFFIQLGNTNFEL